MAGLGPRRGRAMRAQAGGSHDDSSRFSMSRFKLPPMTYSMQWKVCLINVILPIVTVLIVYTMWDNLPWSMGLSSLSRA